MKKVNIKDLAKEIKLSTSTISKALRDSHEISTQTKKLVLDAAEKLGYTPNPFARSLRDKKSKTIALILPEVADHFFSLAIDGIQSVAEEKDYHILIYLSHDSYAIEKNILNQFCRGRVDGVLISISDETTQTDHIQSLVAEHMPLVFFDRYSDEVNAPKVITDDWECGYKAAKHLIEQGCERPIFFSISSKLPICNLRADGFLQAVKEAGLYSSKKNPIIYCTDNAKQTYQQILTTLRQKNRPDGIVTSVERLIKPVYDACHELKLSIPKDIKVVSFSTLETASLLNPSLTTITQPAFEIGKNAAELLFNVIKHGNKVDYSPIRTVLPSVLIERASSQNHNKKKTHKK